MFPEKKTSGRFDVIELVPRFVVTCVSGVSDSVWHRVVGSMLF